MLDGDAAVSSVAAAAAGGNSSSTAASDIIEQAQRKARYAQLCPGTGVARWVSVFFSRMLPVVCSRAHCARVFDQDCLQRARLPWRIDRAGQGICCTAQPVLQPASQTFSVSHPSATRAAFSSQLSCSSNPAFGACSGYLGPPFVPVFPLCQTRHRCAPCNNYYYMPPLPPTPYPFCHPAYIARALLLVVAGDLRATAAPRPELLLRGSAPARTGEEFQHTRHCNRRLPAAGDHLR